MNRKTTGCLSFRGSGWLAVLVLPLLLSPRLPMAMTEPEFGGWQLYLDNDLLSGAGTDRDYTGGVAWSADGVRTADYWFSLDRWLGKVDRVSGMETLRGDWQAVRHSVELGVLLFTPSDITREEAMPNDHPYASLLFLASSRETLSADARHVDHSALTLALLGTRAGPVLQRLIHVAVDGDRPAGWHHQVSAGGEPTLLYSAGRETLLHASRDRGRGFDLAWGAKAGIGYATDIAAQVDFRWGHFDSPWWAFSPHQSDYISLGITEPRSYGGDTGDELFIWGGVSARLRAYNAILQGQFRHSEVSFAAEELNHLIGEVWLGVTRKTAGGWVFSYVLRARTNEIRGNEQASPVWGSLVLAHSFW